jgi:hypothetical protein
MKKTTFFLCATFMIVAAGNSVALVLKGGDTLTTYPDNKYLVGSSKVGYDFVNQVACTSYTDYNGCNNHFELEQILSTNARWTYDLSAPSSGYPEGYGVNMGIINLDSLVTAPPDSIFNKNYVTFDAIPVDSVASRVGCSYWIKTGPDPQYTNRILFAKIRILSFKVLDSANHKAQMRFIYACDINGNSAIATFNFDTFFRSTSVLSLHATASAWKPDRQVYTLTGNRLAVPGEFQSTGGVATVYSLAGRMLERVGFKKGAGQIDIKNNGRAGSVLLLVKFSSEP